MGLIESVSQLASKAAELVSCIKVMEAKFESLEQRFDKLDKANEQFIDRVSNTVDELRRQIACVNGQADSRDSRLKEVERNLNELHALIAEAARHTSRRPQAIDSEVSVKQKRRVELPATASPSIDAGE